MKSSEAKKLFDRVWGSNSARAQKAKAAAVWQAFKEFIQHLSTDDIFFIDVQIGNTRDDALDYSHFTMTVYFPHKLSYGVRDHLMISLRKSYPEQPLSAPEIYREIDCIEDQARLTCEVESSPVFKEALQYPFDQFDVYYPVEPRS